MAAAHRSSATAASQVLARPAHRRPDRHARAGMVPDRRPRPGAGTGPAPALATTARKSHRLVGPLGRAMAVSGWRLSFANMSANGEVAPIRPFGNERLAPGPEAALDGHGSPTAL